MQIIQEFICAPTRPQSIPELHSDKLKKIFTQMNLTSENSEIAMRLFLFLEP
jgi:hypothetical protein